MMYAVIQSGARQLRVKPGDRVLVEKLNAPVSGEVQLDALLVSDGSTTKVGAPAVPGVKVVATVQGEQAGEKLTVFKMRRRKGYRRRTGHRQHYTVLSIADIRGFSSGK